MLYMQAENSGLLGLCGRTQGILLCRQSLDQAPLLLNQLLHVQQLLVHILR